MPMQKTKCPLAVDGMRPIEEFDFASDRRTAARSTNRECDCAAPGSRKRAICRGRSPAVATREIYRGRDMDCAARKPRTRAPPTARRILYKTGNPLLSDLA